MLSSRGDEVGKIQALDLGADDYMTKPFGMDELLARMRAALRHQLQVHGERPIFKVGGLSIDLVRRIVKVSNNVVKLSPKEYGGIYIAGGIAPRIIDYLKKSEFRATFEAKGRFRAYLAAVPTNIIIHPDPAFVGLQVFAERQFSA